MAKTQKPEPALFQEVDIATLQENPDNPRTITESNFEKLVNSITRFPEMLRLRPIVVNSDFLVLGGNMRLRAARAAGLKKVPVMVANGLTDEQLLEFTIKDNVSFGQWDFDMLANDWNEQALDDWGVTVWVDQTTAGGSGSGTGVETEKPKVTDDGYSLFELVMVHTNKLAFLEVLNDIKNRYGMIKQEEAIMKLCEIYKTATE